MTRAIIPAVALAAMLTSVPAPARQDPEGVNTASRGVDLSGEWTPVREEDNTGNTERGDWVGIPMNEAARLRAMAWVASIQDGNGWNPTACSAR